MTPTEQDKELREQVEGIFKNPHCESCHEDWDYDSSYRTDSCCTRFMTDSISKVVGLITADRKRVALEARIEEINYLDDNFQENSQDWERDHPGYSTAMIPMEDYIRRRTELKAQQEKL